MSVRQLQYLFAAAAAAATLTACGGGDSPAPAPSATTPSPPAPSPSPSPSPTPAPAPAPAPTSAASCPALTSGNYRVIQPAMGAQASATGIGVVAMDSAGIPQFTAPDSSTHTLTAGTAPCSFTTSGGGGVVVSPAGIVMVSDLESGNIRYPILLFPEQTIPLSDLTGTWSRIAWQRNDPGGLAQPYSLEYGIVTFSAGAITGGQTCSVAADLSGGCTAMSVPAGTALTVDATGGYSGTSGLSGSRSFAYKNGSSILLVIMDPDGSINILTPQATSSFPTVGSNSASWNLRSDTAGVLAVAGTNAIPGISTTSITITSVDTVNNVVTRDSSDDGAAAVSQTLHYNLPLAGFRKRDGATGVSAAIMMSVPGMGLTAVARLGATAPTTPGTGNGFFNLSVTQP